MSRTLEEAAEKYLPEKKKLLDITMHEGFSLFKKSPPPPRIPVPPIGATFSGPRMVPLDVWALRATDTTSWSPINWQNFNSVSVKPGFTLNLRDNAGKTAALTAGTYGGDKFTPFTSYMVRANPGTPYIETFSADNPQTLASLLVPLALLAALMFKRLT